MALVEGGKQRAISLDYPVYYSPGACLDILNGFMADAGDPALGGGVSGGGEGGSDEAPAPPLGQPEQCGAAPEGTHGPWEGGTAPTEGVRRRETTQHPSPPPPFDPQPGSEAELALRFAGSGAEFYPREFEFNSKPLGQRGWGRALGPAGASVPLYPPPRPPATPAGTRTSTPPRGPAMRPPPCCRPARPTLRY